MKIAKLRNGAEEAEPAVMALMLTLQSLFDEDPIGLYELHETCKDSKHEPWGDSGARLEALGLLRDGRVHDSTRNIVLSAIKGDGLNIALVSPIVSTRGMY